MNMPGKQALQDRSVNIPPATQTRDGAKSTASKKRKSDSNENHADPDDGEGRHDFESGPNPNPKKKVKKNETTGTTGTAQGKKSASSKSKKDDDNDVSSITLDGEDGDAVPVYDTCDDVRTKINRFLRETPAASNAGFVRTINAALPPSSTGQRATAAQLGRFLKKKGPTDGAESPVFYASYVFFEKLRLRRGKPKTKKREEMEGVWGSKGMHLSDLGRRPVICHVSERPYTDQYGQLRFERRGRR
ncbi:uncharacterized protein PV07_04432 [Cladophialophora immunda]|uniref:DUF7726 domain-containing protein n=1 Tax=Cladophialophora immunda TaxID=569365 RepID=A0A0D2DB54_9EURO|nr:uncharacterized protein PV07_04432 [Cladophialophora immunda]KIW32919.1 hypothetical protein PV07_04432 [Cladophialophora immunda]